MRRKIGIMHQIVGSRTLRTLISVLFILNTVFLSSFVMSFLYLGNNEFYTTDGKKLQDKVTVQLMDRSGQDALRYFSYYMQDKYSDNPQNDAERQKTDQRIEDYKQLFDESKSNYFFCFKDNRNITLLFNYAVEDEERIDKSKTQTLDDLNSTNGYASLLKNMGISFEGHLKKEPAPETKDKYWAADRFFQFANKVKYVAFALMILFAVFESVLASMVYTIAGQTASKRRRDLDQIPMYFLLPFYAMLCVSGIFFLYRQSTVLTNLAQVFSGANVAPTICSFFLLQFALAALFQIMLSTVSVRLHRPMWWRRSILYRAFAGRTFGQRARTILFIAVILQFTIYFAFFMSEGDIPWLIYFLADSMVVMTMTVLMYIVYKDMSVYIPQTRRVVAGQIDFVPTEDLSESGRKHAENINFLSRNANTETEKRYINESFSTQLIHSVSDSLRGPLKEVAENVHLLEGGTLTDEQSQQSIAHIITLSEELKKSIEDMILISKASTGNLPIDPVPTDAGMMLSQAIGEFYERFEKAGVEPVTEQPDEPVLICADGQYMWYVFEGVLSVMLENAVAGTRLFMRAGREGENAVIVFRCTVRADALQQLRELSGMGLSSAKVFAILQGGSMVVHLSHDTLMAVLQFPAIAPDKSE